MQTHSLGRGFRVIPLCKSVACAALLGFVISSSAVDGQEAAKNQPPPERSSSKEDEIEQLRKSVRQLSAEVARLRAEVAKLEKYRQIDYLRDLLLKEEQRVDASQKELIDIGAKEMTLQKRLDEIDTELRPDRIQQSLAGVGSMRPEQERQAIELRLSNEKRRIQAQLDQFRQNRVRLQAAISNAEASIVILRQRLKDAVRVAGLRENN
jgi:chromosome segregation ATPase